MGNEQVAPLLAAVLGLSAGGGPIPQARAQGYLHASGTAIVDGSNRPIQLRGMGLGGWLVPEGYMIGTSGFANSPTEFRNKVELVQFVKPEDSLATLESLTANAENAARWVNEVDSAAVYVNASTRFTDGNQFGLGAEVAISTQRLHARGPMALRELTTYKWVGMGNYHIRQ